VNERIGALATAALEEIMARKGTGVYLRGNAWRLDCSINGRRYQLPLGRKISQTAAEQIASLKRAAILKGELGAGAKGKEVSFKDARKLYMGWVKANRAVNTYNDYAICFRQLEERFGERKLSQINSFMVEAYKRKRAEDGATVRPNREISTLRAMYNWLAKHRKFKGENPAARFDRLKESPGKMRILTPEEEALLLSYSVDPLHSLIIIGLHCGLRLKREALALRWKENIDFADRTLTVEAAFSKTHEMREVALNSVALETLQHLKEITPGPWVFMTRGRREKGPWRRLTSFKTAFDTACRHAKLFDVTPHCLRHTWASRLDMSGASTKTLMELGGWKTPEMVAKYSHTTKVHRQRAVEMLANNSTTLSTTPKESTETAQVANVLILNNVRL